MSRNPYFIGILSAILLSVDDIVSVTMSQSLFYWNPFCNKKEAKEIIFNLPVAILILLESFLQYAYYMAEPNSEIGRNPYFIGILSAILLCMHEFYGIPVSQSLFYWNPFCNYTCAECDNKTIYVAILILLESFLQ